MEAAQLAPGSADRPRHIQILDEAARMFNTRGVSSKPLSDLAERLGLSRAALYYYVKGREDLIFQVYLRTCELLDQSLTAAQTGHTDAIAIVQDFVAQALDPEAPDVSVLGELGLLRPEDRESVLGHFERIVGRLGNVLADGQARGEIRPCDVVVAARTIMSIIMSIPTNSAWAILAQGPAMGDRRLLIALAQDMLADGWLSDRSLLMDPPPIDLTPVALPKVAAFDRKGLAEARREAILIAASGLINRKGVDSTSLDEIASAVGATKRTLYQHVGDKLALTMACVRRTARIFHYVFGEALRDLDQLKPTPEVLVRWQRGQASAQLRKDVEPARAVNGIGGLAGSYSDEIRELILKQNEVRQTLISRLQASGQMRTFGELSLIGPPNIWWNSMNWLSRGFVEVGDAQRPRVVAEVVEVLSLGLRSI